MGKNFAFGLVCTQKPNKMPCYRRENRAMPLCFDTTASRGFSGTARVSCVGIRRTSATVQMMKLHTVYTRFHLKIRNIAELFYNYVDKVLK